MLGEERGVFVFQGERSVCVSTYINKYIYIYIYTGMYLEQLVRSFTDLVEVLA